MKQALKPTREWALLFTIRGCASDQATVEPRKLPASASVLAMKTLPAIAQDVIPTDGDERAFTVLARDESGATVYTATLTFAGLRQYDEME